MRIEGIVAALGLLLTGCGTVTFYTQAASGQWEVMRKTRPIDEVLETTRDPALRDRLQLTRRLLAFAEEELGMPSKGAYERYADLGREHLVWVLHAAPELSMEPKRWWYPVVGRQAYRGYFREDLAEKEKVRLEARGFEVWSGGVDAFSTLGWFRDPVLNTFADYEEVDFAETIFHELTHRKYYISGTTDENEALAEAVAREGVRRWFRHTGRPELVERYEERLRKLAQAREAIVSTSDRLRVIYDGHGSESEKRAAKKRELERLNRRLRELRTRWGRGLTSWIEEPVNNARLNAFTTYEERVPHFTKLIEQADGDFETFWKRLEESD